MGQTKDYKIRICCFSAKHAALRRIVCPSEATCLFADGCFSEASTINIQLSMLV
jgi:hypothetical protein